MGHLWNNRAKYERVLVRCTPSKLPKSPGWASVFRVDQLLHLHRRLHLHRHLASKLADSVLVARREMNRKLLNLRDLQKGTGRCRPHPSTGSALAYSRLRPLKRRSARVVQVLSPIVLSASSIAYSTDTGNDRSVLCEKMRSSLRRIALPQTGQGSFGHRSGH